MAGTAKLPIRASERSKEVIYFFVNRQVLAHPFYGCGGIIVTVINVMQIHSTALNTSQEQQVVAELVAKAREAQELYAKFSQQQVDEVVTAIGLEFVAA